MIYMFLHFLKKLLKTIMSKIIKVLYKKLLGYTLTNVIDKKQNEMFFTDKYSFDNFEFYHNINRPLRLYVDNNIVNGILYLGKGNDGNEKITVITNINSLTYTFWFAIIYKIYKIFNKNYFYKISDNAYNELKHHVNYKNCSKSDNIQSIYDIILTENKDFNYTIHFKSLIKFCQEYNISLNCKDFELNINE